MIICDGSALDWWRTPEDVRMRQVTKEDFARLPEDGRLRDCCTIPLRRNEAVRAVHARLLGDLKGVNLPVQAICRPGERDTLSHILYARRSYREIPARYLHDIGGGLAVTAPALTVLRYANNLSLLEASSSCTSSRARTGSGGRRGAPVLRSSCSRRTRGRSPRAPLSRSPRCTSARRF